MRIVHSIKQEETIETWAEACQGFMKPWTIDKKTINPT
jgi:hypothetical protein